jgi:pimeloyl-ACP methyl ester carboxylesterase
VADSAAAPIPRPAARRAAEFAQPSQIQEGSMVDVEPVTEVLDVPGATLRYQLHGAGPLLVLIPGGAADSTIFAPLLPHLTGTHTVLTFDPRGIGRSTIDEPAQEITIPTQADDVRLLLDKAGGGPARVFASSGGAITALELVTRHPDHVRTLVLHEPPLVELLPDRDALHAALDALAGICRAAGPEAAMREFLRATGQLTRTDLYTLPARMRSDVEFFLEHMIRPIVRYRPDPTALPELAVGAGTGTGQLGHRGAHALAELLGIPATPFPGEHIGFATHARPAAAVLLSLLDSRMDDAR